MTMHVNVCFSSAEETVNSSFVLNLINMCVCIEINNLHFYHKDIEKHICIPKMFLKQ